jgi:hypothetical protein
MPFVGTSRQFFLYKYLYKLLIRRLGKQNKRLQTWMKRKGLATKLLGNPTFATSAHVTTGFATGHAAPGPLEIPHCVHKTKLIKQHHHEERDREKPRRG